MSSGHSNFGLVAEHPPVNSVRTGTANLVRTLCSFPTHPFRAAIGTDHSGPNPISGPWENVPSLALFRPRSLFPHVHFGLGLLDNTAFRFQKKRAVHFLEDHGVRTQFILLANNPRFASFAAHLSDTLPKTVYIVDDFVADSPIYRFDQDKAQSVLDKLVMDSDQVFAISPVYASDLESRYGRPCKFLPLPIPDDLIHLAAQAPLVKDRRKIPDDDTLIFHHSGQIHHLYADALFQFIVCLRDIAKKRKRHMHLELWGTVTPQSLEKSMPIKLADINREEHFKIRFCREVPPIELLHQQRQADFLLAVNSFLPEKEKQVRCSFSSKICEYMVSGTPILVFAPPYSGIAAHLAKHKAAHIITHLNLSSDLEKIIDDPLRDSPVGPARTLAKNQHSTQSFLDTLLPEDKT